LYLQCVADVEAFIDFSEDQDLEESVVSQGMFKLYYTLTCSLHFQSTKEDSTFKSL